MIYVFQFKMYVFRRIFSMIDYIEESGFLDERGLGGERVGHVLIRISFLPFISLISLLIQFIFIAHTFFNHIKFSI